MGLDVTDRIHIEGLSPAHVAMLKQVASEAAELAVKSMLTKMGVDPDKPFEAQADFQFLRSTRARCEGGRWQAVVVTIGIAMTFIATVIGLGIKALLGK